jgi:hypothetical protein
MLGRLVRAHGGWVPAPELAECGGLQFSARLFEIRHDLGFNVENRIETVNGTKKSWYRLRPGPQPSKPQTTPIEPAEPRQQALALPPRHLDLG